MKNSCTTSLATYAEKQPIVTDQSLAKVLFIDEIKLNFKMFFFCSFALGVKFALAPDATLRAKVNNSSQIGLSYQQKLRDGEN